MDCELHLIASIGGGFLGMLVGYSLATLTEFSFREIISWRQKHKEEAKKKAERELTDRLERELRNDWERSRQIFLQTGRGAG